MNPISDNPSDNKEIERLKRKLEKASEGNSINTTENGTYYGLNKIKEKKESSKLWKFLVLIIFIAMIIASIYLLSMIISGKIDVYSLFKDYAVKN